MMDINICPDHVKTKNGIKRDRRLVRTKKAIISALIELLTEKDLSEITVTELTERAEINRKTFYLHYDRIENIIADFGEDMLTYTERILREHVEKQGSVKIEVLFDAINSAITDNLEFFRMFVRSGAYHIFISTQMRSEYIKSLRATIAMYFRGGVLLSPYVMEFIVSGATAMYVRWLETDIPTVSLDTVSETASRMVAATLNTVGEA